MIITIKNNNQKIKTIVMIKKQLIMLSLSLFIGMTTFAQKNEVKAADKALKKKNYPAALSALSQAESLIANADAKTKAKFYYIKGMALYADGKNAANNEKAAEAFTKLLGLEKNGSGTKYSTKAGQILNNIIISINTQATNAYNEARVNQNPEGYKKAAEGFYKVFQLSPADTTSLYSSAYLLYFGKDYQNSLDRFQQLLDMNYSGAATIYKAKNIVNGAEMTFNSKKEMDKNVKIGIAKDPEIVEIKSKKNDIIKFMALDYVGLGENDKALEAISIARKSSPEDYDLIVSEANIYYEMGDKVKYAEKIEEAIKISPNNPELYYNVGTLSMDVDAVKAKKFLLKAIELKPDYAEAYGNLGNLILQGVEEVQKEMDANAMNFAKYDQIKAEKLLPILKESLPYLEKAYELKPTDAAKKQLNSLYENLDMEKRIE